MLEFQSTHPAWGATLKQRCALLFVLVSIHAPRVGCDYQGKMDAPATQVSIHAPRVGCDRGRLPFQAW